MITALTTLPHCRQRLLLERFQGPLALLDSLKIGGDISYEAIVHDTLLNNYGVFSFNGSKTGNAYADFLLDRNRPREILRLLRDDTKNDGLLLRGRYRYRLLINARRSSELQRVIRDWLSPLRFPQGVRVAVDIDPYSFV